MSHKIDLLTFLFSSRDLPSDEDRASTDRKPTLNPSEVTNDIVDGKHFLSQ